VGDVALVEKSDISRDRAFFVGADPAISLQVSRSQQGDAIAIQEQVAEIAAEMNLTLP
jgi:multidrug efflux pump subunit AcrB